MPANDKEGLFLTVEQAFDQALENLKGKSKEAERGKIYVWKQRFKEGNLSHKKIASILEKAGFHKVAVERWMPVDPKASQSVVEIDEIDEEHFKD